MSGLPGGSAALSGGKSAVARALRPVPSDAAQEFLDAGLPLDLTVRAARDYLDRCTVLLKDYDGIDCLSAVQLLTAQTLAAVHIDIRLAHEPERLVAEMSERLGASSDGEIARAYARVAWGFLYAGPEHAEARVAAAESALDIAARHNEQLLVPAAHTLLLVGLLEQGQIRALDMSLLDRREGAAPEAHDADPAKWLSALRSILDGDTETAEAQVNEIYDAAKAGQTNALSLYTTQLGMIRWMQGRLDGTEEGFLAARREYPEQLIWASSLAWLWILQGRRNAGEALLQTLPEPEELLRDRYWLSTLVIYVEIARNTGSRERAERLRDMLLPHADHLVAVGVGVAFWGTAARSLGLLEERLGDLTGAREHLELAIETSSRVGALAWHAEAQIELAEFAIRHDISDIPAYELLEEARVTSKARGFAGLVRRAMQRPRLRVLGTFDVVSLCGERAEWTSRKARELLKMLIAARGTATSREVYMEVLWPGEHPSTLGNRFSVAVNVVRRALDPQRLLPTQHYVVTEGDSIRLEIDHLDIDVERFFALAAQPGTESKDGARRLYRGAAFSDEPYADWAVAIREYARHVRETLESQQAADPTDLLSH